MLDEEDAPRPENHYFLDGKMVEMSTEEIAERNAERRAAKEREPQEHAALLRKQRDALLQESDWTQLPDSPLTSEERNQWADYRQNLRDMKFGVAVALPAAPAKMNKH